MNALFSRTKNCFKPSIPSIPNRTNMELTFSGVTFWSDALMYSSGVVKNDAVRFRAPSDQLVEEPDQQRAAQTTAHSCQSLQERHLRVNLCR